MPQCWQIIAGVYKDSVLMLSTQRILMGALNEIFQKLELMQKNRRYFQNQCAQYTLKQAYYLRHQIMC